jgi:hypothetical protein|tara:strand:- start:128 stop:733 length:606 start_codon:yes stop_codon:yes gene_type:complete
MKMKKYLWMMLFLMIPLVQGIVCEESIPIGTNCTMVSPVLTGCSTYNYTIIDTEGTIVEQDDLTLLEGDIYYFNLSLSEGGYSIELCDQTTTQINVGIRNKMVWLAIITALAVMSFIFLISAFNLQEKGLEMLKAMLFLLGTVNGFLIGCIVYIITLHPNNASEFSPVALGYLTFNGVALVGFIYFYVAFLLQRVREEGQL